MARRICAWARLVDKNEYELWRMAYGELGDDKPKSGTEKESDSLTTISMKSREYKSGTIHTQTNAKRNRN